MWARNITGVLQIEAKTGTQLAPGEWVDLDYQIALNLWRARVVELRSPEDLKDHLWKTPDGRLHLFWMSPFSMGDGYATAAENMTVELAQLGVEMHLAPCWFIGRYGLREETLKRLDAPHPGPIQLGLCMATPGEFKKLPTPYKVGLTMYEADDPLRNLPEWRHDCSVVDMLVVPSQYCKEVFSTFVQAPIKVTPLAINPAYYANGQVHKARRDGKFIFGMHGTLTGRKAPTETIEAFMKAFPRDRYPNVEFQLKTRLGILGGAQDDVPKMPDPRITVINQDWLVNRVATWMKTGIDAYVFPSRGEGFGMTPRESMAAGCPTILTNNTGMVEVCNSEYNWPIETHHLEDSPLGGKWRVPDWDALIETMRWVYENRDAAYAKAARGAEWFAKNFGGAKVASVLKDILEGIDPSTAQSPVFPTAETLEQGLDVVNSNHTAFLDVIAAQVGPRGQVIDLGVGEGLLYAALAKRGYKVVGIVTPGRLGATAAKLRAVGVEPELYEVPALAQAATLGIKGDVVASLNVLQETRLTEIRRVFAAMMEIAPKRFFSVPTVHYPNRFSEDAELHRAGYWEDLLSAYDYTTKYYGPSHRYMWASIRALDSGVRGTLVRQPRGRVVDGTWRPLANTEGSRAE